MSEVMRWTVPRPHFIERADVYSADDHVAVVLASTRDAVVKERDELRAFQELGMATRLGMYADVLKENARLREALAALSKRHDWTPGMGECICSEHMAAREILSRDEAKQGDE